MTSSSAAVLSAIAPCAQGSIEPAAAICEVIIKGSWAPSPLCSPNDVWQLFPLFIHAGLHLDLR